VGFGVMWLHSVDGKEKFVLRPAQHERKISPVFMPTPFALSLSKGEQMSSTTLMSSTLSFSSLYICSYLRRNQSQRCEC
jgi:hypothetical protein